MLWRTGVFRWTSLSVLALMSICFVAALNEYSRRSVAMEHGTRAQRDQWLHKQIVNPHVAAHAGTVLFRPLYPLAILDNGIDSFVGTAVFLEAHRRTPFAHASVERVPSAGRFAELTAAVVLQWLVPLSIVLLTSSSFAAEREDGTLPLVLSLGVSPRAVVMGKAIGVTAPVLGLIAPTLLIAALVISLTTSLDPGRALMFGAVYLLYVVVWIGLALAVSLRARRSQTALASLLGLWIVGCLLVPRVAFAAVQRYAPAPTARQFVEALEAESGEGAGFLEQRQAIERRLLTQYGLSNAVDLPVSTWGLTLFEREVDSTKRYNAQFAALFDRYERQQRLIDVVSLFCPALAVRTVSMALAGSDVAHYRDFAEAAERYRYTLVQRMNQIAVDSRLYNSRPTLAGGPDRPIFPEGEEQAYASVGEFSYRTPAAWWAISRTLLPASALVVWLIGLAVFISRSLGRIDIG